MVIIQPQDFSVQQACAQLKTMGHGKAGACVSFVGWVRDFSGQSSIKALYLEHYSGMTERALESICQQARQHWPIVSSLVIHRTGLLNPNEQIVFAGVTSAHRGEAFRACEFIIDQLKTQAPFWKKEILTNGESRWVEQKRQDVQKAQNWQPMTLYAD